MSTALVPVCPVVALILSEADIVQTSFNQSFPSAMEECDRGENRFCLLATKPSINRLLDSVRRGIQNPCRLHSLHGDCIATISCILSFI